MSYQKVCFGEKPIFWIDESGIPVFTEGPIDLGGLEVYQMNLGTDVIYSTNPNLLVFELADVPDHPETWEYYLNGKSVIIPYVPGIYWTVVNEDIKSCQLMFPGYHTGNGSHYREKDFNKITRIIKLPDTSKATTMETMFGYLNVTELQEAVNQLDMSSVEDCAYMFFSEFYLDGKLDFTHIKAMPKCTSVRDMFGSCTLLKEIDMSGIDMPKCTRTDYMFAGCDSLEKVNLPNFASFSVCNNMFYECRSLKEIDLSNIDFSRQFTYDYMFYDCQELVTLKYPNGKVGASVAYSMFYNCNKLVTIEGPLVINIDYSLIISSPVLSRETAVMIFNSLPEGQSYQVISLHNNVLKQLSPQELAIATSKGWTIGYIN